MDALWGDTVCAEVEAPPDDVWQLVADVTRMGEWSPVCRRCEWLPGFDGPEPGARFVGHNRLNGFRWSRECEVTSADSGREFAFRTFFDGRESTRWRYRFEPVAGGTKVVESYETVFVPRWVRFMRRIPGAAERSRRDAVAGMDETLRRIKAAAEERRS